MTVARYAPITQTPAATGRVVAPTAVQGAAAAQAVAVEGSLPVTGAAMWWEALAGVLAIVIGALLMRVGRLGGAVSG